MYLKVASRLDSSLQDLSREMFAVLFLFAFALLLLQRLRNGVVQLVCRLQLRPEVLQIILNKDEQRDTRMSEDIHRLTYKTVTGFH